MHQQRFMRCLGIVTIPSVAVMGTGINFRGGFSERIKRMPSKIPRESNGTTGCGTLAMFGCRVVANAKSFIFLNKYIPPIPPETTKTTTAMEIAATAPELV